MSESAAAQLDELGYIRTVIVGAGQAGLAVGQALINAGQTPQKDFALIDAASPDGTAWRRRWHSLRLFTPAWYSALPGLPFAGDPSAHPGATEFADYLDRYRENFGMRPYWGIRALEVHEQPDEPELTLVTDCGRIRATNVVAATGPFTVPTFPDLARRVGVPGANLHSDEYIGPQQIPDGPVLVIGSGNTGLQIARELAASHDVTIAAGSLQPALPQEFLGQDIFVWLRRSGALSIPARGSFARRLAAREYTIGQSIEGLEEIGVLVKPRAVGASGGRVAFADGSRMRPTSVVWATGYVPGIDWLPQRVRDADDVVQTRGATRMRGLYVVGMPWQSCRASALIGGVGKDAARVAQQIVKQG